MTTRIRWPEGHMPVGIPEIATLLGVQRATVDQWRAREVFPEPDYPVTVGGRRPWKTSTVRRWAVETGRIPTGPRFSRYVSEPGGVVAHLTLDGDDQWQPCCRWNDSDSNPVAHPSDDLKDLSREPELTAHEHMTRWYERCDEWSRKAPGEPLPPHLRPETDPETVR